MKATSCLLDAKTCHTVVPEEGRPCVAERSWKGLCPAVDKYRLIMLLYGKYLGVLRSAEPPLYGVLELVGVKVVIDVLGLAYFS